MRPPTQWPRDLCQENLTTAKHLKGDRPFHIKDYPMRMRASVSKVHDKPRSPTNINQGDKNLTQLFFFLTYVFYSMEIKASTPRCGSNPRSYQVFHMAADTSCQIVFSMYCLGLTFIFLCFLPHFVVVRLRLSVPVPK